MTSDKRTTLRVALQGAASVALPGVLIFLASWLSGVERDLRLDAFLWLVLFLIAISLLGAVVAVIRHRRGRTASTDWWSGF